MLLLLLLQDWAELPVQVEPVGENAYVTFQPIALSALRVNAGFERAQVYGVEGKVETTAEGGLLRFARRSEVAEVVLFRCAAKNLKIYVPKSEARREAKPVPESALTDLGEFKPTFYWVLLEERFAGERDTPLLDAEGKEFGLFPKDFVKQAKIEGTAKLRDGRVINVSGKGFKVVDAPHGLGAGGYHLIPFRSIAVDRNEIALGTRLFVPEAVGMRLPDGTIHDGLFYAHDVGGGIKGRRVDFFTGTGRRQDVFEKAGVRNRKPVRIYAVKP